MSVHVTRTEVTQIDRNVIQALMEKPRLDANDFWALLSPAATPFLDELAVYAHERTVARFGKEIELFEPLYCSDHCVNTCVYCSFSLDNAFKRSKLTMEELKREAAVIRDMGIRHLLILTGESPVEAGVDYLVQCVQELRGMFERISIEVQPLDESEYARLVEAGVSGLTLYQETYDKTVYKAMHPKGPKRNFAYRYASPDRACRAGIHRVTMGALLGLSPDWREDVFRAGLHLVDLLERYPGVEGAMSFPRMRPHGGGWNPERPVSDDELMQAMVAVRLFRPQIGITLSTREPEALRNRLFRYGVTKMSAGSSTAVGGYAEAAGSQPQFAISDERSVAELGAFLEEQGYRTV